VKIQECFLGIIMISQDGILVDYYYYYYFWGFGKICSRTAGEVLVNRTKTLQAADKKLLINMSDQT
jgi:hypothetical protein